MPQRLALVTGGVTGIGAATCVALQKAGFEVVANYFGNDQDAADFHMARKIPIYAWNVAEFTACQKGVVEIERLHGPIEVLVNNAGVTRDAMLHKMSSAQWCEVIDVDLGGCFNMCRQVVPGMRERRFGRIINVSSVNALSGQVGQTNYAAAKAGIIGLTKALALEGAAFGITVNAVAPGYTDTALVAAVRKDIVEQIVARVPVARLGRPEEIARCIVFLAADEAGFITGSTLSVNGGKYLA